MSSRLAWDTCMIHCIHKKERNGVGKGGKEKIFPQTDVCVKYERLFVSLLPKQYHGLHYTGCYAQSR